MIINKWCLIAVIAFLSSLHPDLQSQTTDSLKRLKWFEPEKVFLFANHLQANGDFQRAAWEFERYASMSVNNDDTLVMRIATCYELAEDFPAAFRKYNLVEASRATLSELLLQEAQYRSAAVMYKLNNNHEVTNRCDSLLTHPNYSEGLLLRTSLLASAAATSEREWVRAERYIQTPFSLKSSTSTDSLARYKPLLDTFARLIGSYPDVVSNKSPLVAALLSTVIPGTGKIYSGQTMDGIISFFTVGTSAWASYDGFKSSGSSSFRGWFFGALAGSLYLGNIYGSALSATIMNDVSEKRLILSVRTSLSTEGLP